LLPILISGSDDGHPVILFGPALRKGWSRINLKTDSYGRRRTVPRLLANRKLTVELWREDSKPDHANHDNGDRLLRLDHAIANH
jgi:hypothetical protein